jgi:ATP-dependent helicase HrpB
VPAPLPIDDVLPALCAAVATGGAAVLVAPPGAGKTTRVPGAILDAGLAGSGDVVVLEPRRLAARMSAARVAHERGGGLGGEIGYEVRFDRKVGGATRIRYVTEGILSRRLLDDPTLRGTGCVIVDEFHERHLASDLALAAVARLRAGPRPDLRVIVMSATLDAEPVARFLAAPILVSEGRTFPVAVEHLNAPDDRSISKQVVTAVRRLLAEALDGDILVFLPGATEIRHCTEDLAELATRHDLAVVPLHGDLAADEQDRAIARSPRRKVILSTNVAETSVTIDGVVAVIDSGVARVARHSPWSGLPALMIEPISRASAAQRAGRAGRTRPGRCLRLYTRHDHDLRRAHDAPEVARADLAEAALELYAAGVAPLEARAWFEPPPEAAIRAADELLHRLGAITDADRPALTPIGQRMLRFPAHPRQARILVEAERRGVASEGAIIAAALGARELRVERRTGFGSGPRSARLASSSDLIDDLDAILGARDGGLRADRLRSLGLDVAAAHQVDRAARQLERLTDRRAAHPIPTTADAVDAALELAILTGYPDRVARRRAPRASEFVLAGGGSATIAPTSAVIDADLIVAVDVGDTGDRGRAARTTIRRASRIDPAWLLDLYFDRIRDDDELIWNRDKSRVERRTRLVYDGLTIDEQVDVEGARRAGAAASAVLAREAIAAGIGKFVDAERFAAWRARIAFASQHAPAASGLRPLTDDELALQIGRACDGLIAFDELRKADLLALLDAALAPHRALIDRLAPHHLGLPRRRKVEIHYELDRPPWIASRMQDFFGLARAPAVADGAVPLVLHLLAPNQRPVQVTADLPGFWIKHYPALRRELSRKYPRHSWPEDPTIFIEA